LFVWDVCHFVSVDLTQLFFLSLIQYHESKIKSKRGCKTVDKYLKPSLKRGL